MSVFLTLLTRFSGPTGRTFTTKCRFIAVHPETAAFIGAHRRSIRSLASSVQNEAIQTMEYERRIYVTCAHR